MESKRSHGYLPGGRLTTAASLSGQRITEHNGRHTHLQPSTTACQHEAYRKDSVYAVTDPCIDRHKHHSDIIDRYTLTTQL